MKCWFCEEDSDLIYNECMCPDCFKKFNKSLKEVELIREGKLPRKTWKELYNELMKDLNKS